MKKLFLTLVLLVGMFFGAFAQKLTYQAVIRDNSQQLVTNTAVKATVTITFATGTPTTYSEEVNATTNNHGLLSIEFGGDALNGRDWTNATIAVKVVNAATPSTVYVNDDARPVSAVPYALSVNGQSIQNYLTEHNYVDLDKLKDTLNAYPTTAVMDARHYLTSDSAVIKTMQGNITTNANSIANLTLHTAKNAIRDSVAGQIHDSIKTVAAKAHEHSNKALLDTYTQTEANLVDAVAKRHAHANAAVLALTQAPYTKADSIKLKGIADSAEVNVQSDWKQTDGSKDDYIKNKPSIKDTVNKILTTGGYLTSASDVITTLKSDLSAAIGKEKTDSSTLAGRIDALEGAAMNCTDVKNCIKDTLNYYSTTAALNVLLQQIEKRFTDKLDSLARIVDSLSKLPHGGGDEPATFTCGTDKVQDADGNEYNTVQIGNQCWMAQNLRTNVGGGVYPTEAGNDTITYGRLYTWDAMMNNTASTNYPASGDKVQGICPTGWHVPSDAEWDTLTRYVFSKDEYKCGDDCGEWQAQSDVSCIAKALSQPTGWSNTGTGCNAGNTGDKANATGFAAVPAGYCLSGYFYDFGGGADFWSATQHDGDNARYRYLGGHVSRVYWNNDGYKGLGFSVRCLRDAGIGGGGTTPVPVEVSCEQVMECMGDTLGKLNTKIEEQGQKMDSLAHLVDSLAKLPHGGGEVADGQPCPGAPTVSDGTNTYNTVKIGNQCWMKENLRTTTKRNGVGNIYTNNTTDGYNAETYGYYYDWAAVMQDESGDKVRGICPEGWHVPSDAEWTALTDYVKSKAEYKCGDGADNIANALSSSTGWQSPSECAAGHNSTTLNKTGFSAVPAGICLDSDFQYFGDRAYFWSATQDNDSYVWARYLESDDSNVYWSYGSKDNVYSVRCLRDAGVGGGTTPVPVEVSCEQVMECMGDTLGKLNTKIEEQGQKIDSLANLVDSLANLPHGGDTPATFTCGTDKVQDADGNEYNTVKIGTQCWMKENLRTDVHGGVYPKKNDGDTELTADEQVTYGRLYTWNAMMNNTAATNYPESGIKVQGICPTGWHVPSNAEWNTLTRHVFNSTSPNYKCGSSCGSWSAQSDVNCIANALSAETGWYDPSECCAGHSSATLNTTGFAAVPAGLCYDGFGDFGDIAYFWSATDGEATRAWILYLSNENSTVAWNGAIKDLGLSVRCLHD